jgi:hypothetical protein
VLTVEGSCAIPTGLDVHRLSTLTLGHATLTEVRDDDGLLFRSLSATHPAESAWVSTPRRLRGALRYLCHFYNPDDRAVLAGGLEGQDEVCMVMAHVEPADSDLVCVDDVMLPAGS